MYFDTFQKEAPQQKNATKLYPVIPSFPRSPSFPKVSAGRPSIKPPTSILIPTPETTRRFARRRPAQEFPKLVSDPKVKAIVVTGKGNMFCGGRSHRSHFGRSRGLGRRRFRLEAKIGVRNEWI